MGSVTWNNSWVKKFVPKRRLKTYQIRPEHNSKWRFEDSSRASTVLDCCRLVFHPNSPFISCLQRFWHTTTQKWILMLWALICLQQRSYKAEYQWCTKVCLHWRTKRWKLPKPKSHGDQYTAWKPCIAVSITPGLIIQLCSEFFVKQHKKIWVIKENMR